MIFQISSDRYLVFFFASYCKECFWCNQIYNFFFFSEQLLTQSRIPIAVVKQHLLLMTRGIKSCPQLTTKASQLEIAPSSSNGSNDTVLTELAHLRRDSGLEIEGLFSISIKKKK